MDGSEHNENGTGYTKRQIMALLKVGSTTYHKICRLGLLESYRLFPGGPIRHSPEQFNEFLERRKQASRFSRRRVARM